MLLKVFQLVQAIGVNSPGVCLLKVVSNWLPLGKLRSCIPDAGALALSKMNFPPSRGSPPGAESAVKAKTHINKREWCKTLNPSFRLIAKYAIGNENEP